MNICICEYQNRTVGKIYTPIFSSFWKRVVNITNLELGHVSNESPGNYTYYRGIHEFFNPFIFAKNNGYFDFML